MAKIIPTDKARQGHWGRHVLLILIVALLLTAVVWAAVAIYGEAIEGDTGRQTCVLRGGPCGLDGTCTVHPVFFAAQESIRTELRRATLEQLARGLTAP